MLWEHERNYDLGMDALGTVRRKNCWRKLFNLLHACEKLSW